MTSPVRLRRLRAIQTGVHQAAQAASGPSREGLADTPAPAVRSHVVHVVGILWGKAGARRKVENLRQRFLQQIVLVRKLSGEMFVLQRQTLVIVGDPSQSEFRLHVLQPEFVLLQEIFRHHRGRQDLRQRFPWFPPPMLVTTP